MRIFVLGLLCFPVFALATGVDGAINMAHKLGFTKCDAQIAKTFEFSTGADTRVETAWFDETKKESLKITVTSSDPDDSTFVEGEFRVKDKECFVTKTMMISVPYSCTDFAEKQSDAFKLTHSVGEFDWLETKHGVNLFLKSLNGGCIAIYQINNK